MWTAPEIHEERPYGLPADVYSFGIFMWEVLSRQAPFAHLKTVWAVRNAVVAGERPPVPADQDEDFVALMQACWSGNDRLRPTFAAVVRRLEAMCAGQERPFEPYAAI